MPGLQDTALPQDGRQPKDEALARFTFDAAELALAFPPRFSHPNKRAVYRVACPTGARHSGAIEFTRWPEMRLPDAIPAGRAATVEARADLFGYEPVDEKAGTVEWYVNFADPELFCAYGGPLFAQDEMQVAEHPILASLREALIARRVPARTAENDRPTPVLVFGAERRCAIATAPDSAEGRPQGLYGNRFAEAAEETVVRATRPLSPPTRTNLIAISALTAGRGTYQFEEIECLLATAYTGFRAARLESLRVRGNQPVQVTVHTGFWGCGAFGGNRELMALIQILAARLASVDRLIFHAVDPSGVETFRRAEQTLAELLKSNAGGRLRELKQRIAGRNYRWGTSDEN
jgi:hypothetical protein